MFWKDETEQNQPEADSVASERDAHEAHSIRVVDNEDGIQQERQSVLDFRQLKTPGEIVQTFCR